MTKPLFVVFEGIDGSGKTYQVDKVKVGLQKLGVPVATLHAPSKGRWGKIAREIITGVRKDVHPKEELSAFIEDLAEISIREIAPLLSNGITVLLDRYVFSTWAYQGLKHDDIDFVVPKVFECLCKPDLVCVLDVPVKESLRRMQESRRGGDKYESQEILEKIRAKYLYLFEKNNIFSRFDLNFKLFDATLPKEQTTGDLMSEVWLKLLTE